MQAGTVQIFWEMGMGLGDRERIGHVQFQVCFLGGESNYDSCPIACEIRTTGQNIRIRYLSAIDQFCYELSNDFLEPTEIVDCHGEFLEGSHKTMAGYGTKNGVRVRSWSQIWIKALKIFTPWHGSLMDFLEGFSLMFSSEFQNRLI